MVRNGTIFFVFISGLFFAHLYRADEALLPFWRKKTTRIILPYLVAAVPGILWVSYLKGLDLKYLLMTLVTGVHRKNDPHWYVPFIVLVFALYPLLRILQRNGRMLSIVTAVSLLVGVFSFRSILTLIHF